jgi:putative hemolysin
MARHHLQPFTATTPTPLFADFSQKILDYNGTRKINKIFKELNISNKDFFIESLLLNLNIQFNIKEDDLKKIPTQGAFAVVANHPFGIIDALLMMKVIKTIRPEFKVVDDGITKKALPHANDIISYHPLEKELSYTSSLGGANEIFQNFEEGNPVGFFPSENISSFQTDSGVIEDGIWNNKVIKIISTAEVPVLPIYFEGNNSVFFHLIGSMFSGFKHAKLPSELLNKKGTIIDIRIGTPIPVKQLKQFHNTSKLSRFLRAKTYGLKGTAKVKKFYLSILKKKPKVPQEIIPPVAKSLIIAEIDALKQKGNLLLSQQQFEVYLSDDVATTPNIITEIARLREVTFREVGEGTGMKHDLDEYDVYYKQLILWDNEEKNVAGGYRLGLGDYITQRYGIKGFYTRSLFKIDEELLPVLQHAVELGRSYIAKEYQQKRLPLFLLWKGILAFLERNPRYRYLFGPVSISNKYSDISKSLIIEFIKRNYFDSEIAQYIKPKKKFQAEVKNVDIDILVETAESDIKLIDRYIQDFNPDMSGVPILLKKYLNQKAKIVGFNTDPKFSDVLDGLMFLDLNEVPSDTIEILK